jgi:uncharacterized 2Fe-2S/4Fe-4S cluster protein (DUF4445 family)
MCSIKTEGDNDHHWVSLEPVGRRVRVRQNTSILGAAQQAGIEITAVCGGIGSCGLCKVRPISGDFSPPCEEEIQQFQKSEINSGLRLACCTQILSDCTVQIPPESLATLQRLQLESVNNNFEIDPVVERVEISLHLSEKIDNHTDTERVRNFLKVNRVGNAEVPANLIPVLRKVLDQYDGNASIVRNKFGIITAISPYDKLLGFAVDIGTTKIAGYLVDLQTGQTLASSGAINPQVAYGEDVISRIKYSDEHPQGAELLQKILVQAINALLTDLCKQISTTPDRIVDSVMVGNTAMHHFLAGLPVHSLGTAPYTPACIQAMCFPAREVGLSIAENGYLYLPPNIAGFVGSDHIAMLLATDARHRGNTVVALDIGTNTEISLIHRGHHFACSCASGPAFEGAHTRNGLRAISGAIERVFIDKDGVKIQTINNSPAIGICGSGILDSVAEMRRENLIDSRGTFNKADIRLHFCEGLVEFVLVPAQVSGNDQEIAINRKDVNEIQLAKAAIRSGIEVLLKQAHINSDEVELFLVAGAFGTYLDLQNSLRIGMFPSIPYDRFQQVGNAAGSGARELLVSNNQRLEAEKMGESIEYIELTSVQYYQDIFMDAIRLG